MLKRRMKRYIGFGTESTSKKESIRNHHVGIEKKKKKKKVTGCFGEVFGKADGNE